MKNQKGSVTIIAIILIVVALSVSGFYFYKKQRIDIDSPAPVIAVESKNEDRELKCYLTEKYFVIVKQDYENLGEYILVKNRVERRPNNCEYVVNQDNFAFSGENFEDIEGDFLVTDAGSAPGPRGLQVYDLRIGKQVFSDTYSNIVNANNGELTYWKVLDEKPTLSSCPKLKEYYDNAYLRSWTTVSLKDLRITNIAQMKECLPLQ